MQMSVYKDFLREKMNLPENDLRDLPASTKTFAGGAHYRMEIPGIETAENFEVLVKESQLRKMQIHRVVGTVGGSARLDFGELKYYAQIGADSKIEVLLNPVPTRGWDNGRQYVTPEGYVSGMRIRGMDNLNIWLREFDRCLEAGIRGFLIPDEGLLLLLGRMRAENVIPRDVKFKVSVFAGHGNALGGKLLESLGADSFNPLADLDLSMLAAIRSATGIPVDVYMSIVDSMGGHQRFVESAEIARICAPVYFKFEPGKNECDLYNAWNVSSALNELTKTKVKYAKICMEWCQRSEYDLVFNDYTEDLSIPEV